MPTQVVNNTLDLPQIPNGLANLTYLERRLASLRIPLIKILLIHKTGSHYKINGLCVNMPTTLNALCKVLPQIPDKTQIVPMKLKQKLVYKGCHMSTNNMKDIVKNALK